MSGRRMAGWFALLALATFVGWWFCPVRGYAAEVHTVKLGWTQPYGGCVEAHRYPHSRGARECRAHGWTIRTRLVVGPHHWVRFSTLPHCETEDGSHTHRPCSWNFDRTDGNGIGRSYWIGRHGHTHYVRVHRPAYVAPPAPPTDSGPWILSDSGWINR